MIELDYVAIEKEIVSLEEEIWEALKENDVKMFLDLVSPEALMIWEGMRVSGHKFAEVVSKVKVSEYLIDDVVVKIVDENRVFINYLLQLTCIQEFTDMSGCFTVSSLWTKTKDHWQMVFYQDTRIMLEDRYII